MSAPVVIHAKPGTHPACFMRVKGLRRNPEVGERIQTKRSNHLGKQIAPGEKWAGWRVTGISGDLFLLEAAW